jgi:SRSO17 transposase
LFSARDACALIEESKGGVNKGSVAETDQPAETHSLMHHLLDTVRKANNDQARILIIDTTGSLPDLLSEVVKVWGTAQRGP